MQSADDVKFSCTFANPLLGALIDFVQRIGVGTGRIGIAAKSAQFAMRHANIGRINVAVDVEVRHVAVLVFAHVVREPSDGQQVR